MIGCYHELRAPAAYRAEFGRQHIGV